MFNAKIFCVVFNALCGKYQNKIYVLDQEYE